MMIAPAAAASGTTTASALAMLSSRIFEWHVVGRPATSMMSLMPTGTPCSGPRTRPAAISASAARAASIAASASSRMKACSFGFEPFDPRQQRRAAIRPAIACAAANARAASAAVSQCSVGHRSVSPRASAARVRRPDRWDRRRRPCCPAPVRRRPATSSGNSASALSSPAARASVSRPGPCPSSLWRSRHAS